jgi:hypothetical protein
LLCPQIALGVRRSNCGTGSHGNQTGESYGPLQAVDETHFPRITRLLTAHGHSSDKAADIVLLASRSDASARQWIKVLAGADTARARYQWALGTTAWSGRLANRCLLTVRLVLFAWRSERRSLASTDGNPTAGTIIDGDHHEEDDDRHENDDRQRRR